MSMLAAPAHPWKIWVAFWSAALFWGTSFLWIKLGLENWNPVSLVCLRLLMASALFAAALWATGTRIRLSAKQWAVLVVVALLNPGLPFILISWAEVSIESGVASILNATVPLFLLILAPLFLPEEKPGVRTFVGIMIGFFGVAVLFSANLGAGIAGSREVIVGEIAVLAASLFYAASTVILRRTHPPLTPLAQAAVMNGIACLVLWAYALLSGEWQSPPAGLSWVASVWLGVLGSFCAYTAAMYVLEKRGATQVALINFAYPLLGLGLGMLFLGEPFSWRLVIGGLLIISGIGLVKFKRV